MQQFYCLDHGEEWLEEIKNVEEWLKENAAKGTLLQRAL